MHINKELTTCNAELIQQRQPLTPATNAVIGFAKNVQWMYKGGYFAAGV